MSIFKIKIYLDSIFHQKQAVNINNIFILNTDYFIFSTVTLWHKIGQDHSNVAFSIDDNKQRFT